MVVIVFMIDCLFLDKNKITLMKVNYENVKLGKQREVGSLG